MSQPLDGGDDDDFEADFEADFGDAFGAPAGVGIAKPPMEKSLAPARLSQSIPKLVGLAADPNDKAAWDDDFEGMGRKCSL